MRAGSLLLPAILFVGCFQGPPAPTDPTILDSELLLSIQAEIDNGTKRYEIRSSRLGISDSLARFQLNVPQGGAVRLSMDVSSPNYSEDPGCVAWSYDVWNPTNGSEDPSVSSSQPGTSSGRADSGAAAYFAYRVSVDHVQVHAAGQTVTAPSAVGGGTGTPRSFGEERSWEFQPGAKLNVSLGSSAHVGTELAGGLVVATIEVDADAVLTRLDDTALRCGVGLADAAATAGAVTAFPQASIEWTRELTTVDATTVAFVDSTGLLATGRIVLPEATTEIRSGLANGALVELKRATQSSGRAAIELDQAVFVTAASPAWLLADAYWPGLSIVEPFD